jgi:hypothetical protein
LRINDRNFASARSFDCYRDACIAHGSSDRYARECLRERVTIAGRFQLFESYARCVPLECTIGSDVPKLISAFKSKPVLEGDAIGFAELLHNNLHPGAQPFRPFAFPTKKLTEPNLISVWDLEKVCYI